jgi:hypothetical protein
MLAMMVDLEDEADWSVSDDPEDEDCDRYLFFLLLAECDKSRFQLYPVQT